MIRETIITFLEDFAARGDETALTHRRGLRISRWSYARVATAAFQFARELEMRGISKGDRVLLWAENSPEWIAVFFGCLLRGTIVVPLDVQSAPDFVARIHQQVEAKLLLKGSNNCAEPIVKLPVIRLEELEQLIARHSTEPYTAENIIKDDIAEIIYTSGTTAEPRGVVLTHRNLLANIRPLEHEIQKYLKWERFVHPIRFLNLLPLSHIFGQLMGMFVPPLLGGEVFLQESLKPSEIIETVKRQRISVIVAVPHLLDSLREKIERDYAARGRLEEFRQTLASAEGWHPLKRWWVFREIHRRFGWKFWAFISGGATLAPETENFWQRLGFAVLQGYGMTETASLISVKHPFKSRRGTVGQALPGQEVKLDETGQIMVRGENVSPGYWKGGVQPLTNNDGWLRTGDVGELDQSGNLLFKGREKDVIVTAAGLNIYPEDLEAALNRQPEVRASVVIGVEGFRGPEPLAVLILRDAPSDAAAAVRRANETLVEYQQIRRWAIWPERDFPRTPTQKVRKREVAEKVKAYTSLDPSTPPSSSALVETIGHLTGGMYARLEPNAKLATDLNLDSLGRVELLSALEDRYQIDIDEAAFTAATTLGEIEKMVHEGAQEAAPQYPYQQWVQRFPITWIRLVFFYLLILPLTRLMCWVRVSGAEHLREARQPLLFVSNHISMVDHALILSALPTRFRTHLAIAMDGEILRGWRHTPEGTGWFTRLRWLVQYVLVVTLFNVFPLPKKSGFRRSFAYAGETMDRGYSLLVFPEGERVQDSRMKPFMLGIGLLTANLRAAVVPVKISGLFELKQQGRHFAWPGEVTVTFGEPVRFDDEEPTQITRALEKRVATL